MPLENANNISQLDVNNPVDGETAEQGDDHLRLIKTALKGSFPSFDGTEAVSLSEAEINALPQAITDAVAALRTELLALIAPTGGVILWPASSGAIPAGWQLMDGSNGTPDWRDKFVLCEGGVLPATGGATSASTSTAGAHDHSGETAAHTLTVQQIPSHGHDLRLDKSVAADDATGGAAGELLRATRNYVYDNRKPTVTITSTGGGQGHKHGISSGGAHQHTVSTLPPYVKAAYIIKMAEAE